MEITKFLKGLLSRIIAILAIILCVCYIISGAWLIVWIITGHFGTTIFGDLVYKSVSHIVKHHE